MIILLLRLIYRFKTMIKYAVSGLAAFFTQLTILFLLVEFAGLHYLAATTGGFVVAFFVSFGLQKFWTFRDKTKDRIYRQLGVYFLVALGNLGINDGGMYVLVDHFGVMYLLAQVITGGLIAVGGFLVYRFYIFRRGYLAARQKWQAEKRAGLNILVATGIFPPDIGGPATYAANLGRELGRLGAGVKIVAYGDPPFPAGEKNDTGPLEKAVFYIDRTKPLYRRYLEFFQTVWRLALWADIVYVLDLMSAGLPGLLAGKAAGKPVIFRSGGDFLWEKAAQSGWTDQPLDEYYRARKSGREKALAFICRRILREMDAVIFSTPWQADIYRDHYGLPAGRISVIPNVFPGPAAVPPAAGGERAILFAGRLVRLKNGERLLRAFARLSDRTVRLLFYGEGPERKRLEALSRELGAAARVEFRGRVGQAELRDAIRRSLFVVLPSWSEISPHLALECLGLRQPIVITRATGLPAEVKERLVTVDPLDEHDLYARMEELLDGQVRAAYAARLSAIPLPARDWREVAADNYALFMKFAGSL